MRGSVWEFLEAEAGRPREFPVPNPWSGILKGLLLQCHDMCNGAENISFGKNHNIPHVNFKQAPHQDIIDIILGVKRVLSNVMIGNDS